MLSRRSLGSCSSCLVGNEQLATAVQLSRGRHLDDGGFLRDSCTKTAVDRAYVICQRFSRTVEMPTGMRSNKA